ncbi:MAG: UvrABC system protein A, partial [Candidatus Woesebacteria bacterium GW2011_GWB1_41_10]
LGVMDKPDVDYIDGLSPAISIDQKTTSHNPRSTIGTVTEIYDYLRLLFARVGHPHCSICGREIARQSLDQIVEQANSLLDMTYKKEKKAWFVVLAPVIQDRKGEFSQLLENLKSKGYRQVRIDGFIHDLSEDIVLIKTNKHNIEVVVDRLSGSGTELKSRLADSIQQALNLSEGLLILSQILDSAFEIPDFPKKFKDNLFSEKFSCPVDNISLPEIEPRTFSFNSPHGACPTCTGLGKILKVDASLVFSDELTILEGGIRPFANMIESDSWFGHLIRVECQKAGIDLSRPVEKQE